MANIFELQHAFSKTAQTDINTASTDLLRVSTTSQDLALLSPQVEDDTDEIGTGVEFATTSTLASWKTSKKFSCYLSSESLALAGAFGLGNGTTNTFTPIDPTTNTNGIELPWMTVLEGIRKGGSAEVVDREILGMVVDKWRLSLKKGPGKTNSTLEMDLVGTGKYNEPSALDMPDKTTTHRLGAESLALTINGTDYVTSKNFESLDFEWDNALREGYFPGSGTQDPDDPASGQIMGRMEFGKRKVTLKFVARFNNGSTELATLKAQSAGTAVMSLSGSSGNDATLTFPQTRFQSVDLKSEADIVTVEVTVSAQYDLTGPGILTMVVNHPLGTVGRS